MESENLTDTGFCFEYRNCVDGVTQRPPSGHQTTHHENVHNGNLAFAQFIGFELLQDDYNYTQPHEFPVYDNGRSLVPDSHTLSELDAQCDLPHSFDFLNGELPNSFDEFLEDAKDADKSLPYELTQYLPDLAFARSNNNVDFAFSDAADNLLDSAWTSPELHVTWPDTSSLSFHYIREQNLDTTQELKFNEAFWMEALLDQSLSQCTNGFDLSIDSCFESSSSTMIAADSSSPGRRPCPRIRYNNEDWRKIKPHFVKLYIEKDLSLTEVMHRLSEEHDFHATKPMYKKRITKWRISKNLTTARKLETLRLVETKIVSQPGLRCALEDDFKKLVRYQDDLVRNGTLRRNGPQFLNFRIHMVNGGFLAGFLQLCLPEPTNGVSDISTNITDSTDNFLAVCYLSRILEFNGQLLQSNDEITTQNSFSHTAPSLQPCFQHVNIDRNTQNLFEVCDVIMRDQELIPSHSVDKTMRQLSEKLDDASIFFELRAYAQGAMMIAEACDILMASVAQNPLIIVCLLPFATADQWQICQKVKSCLLMALEQALKQCSTIPHTLQKVCPETDLDVFKQRLLWNRLHRLYVAKHGRWLQLWSCIFSNQLRSHQGIPGIRQIWRNGEKCLQSLRQTKTFDEKADTELVFEMLKAYEQFSDAIGDVESYDKIMRLANRDQNYRLQVRVNLRLAEVLGSVLKNPERRPSTSYIQAFETAFSKFGMKHSHTILAFTKLRDHMAEEEYGAVLDTIEEDFEATKRYYASIFHVS